MSRPLKKKAIPMICFESQECYPKAHLTSKSFRFVLFRPFSVLFRQPKSNYLFKLLPHMFRPLKKKAIPMICFESQECYPKAHLTSKSFRFVLFRPFSVLFRPPKSNYLFKLLPHMFRPLTKKAIPMICFESQECYPKAHLISTTFRFVLFRPFSVLYRPPKSNYLFKLVPHMSRPLKKKAIPMICFESQECYPKAHLTSKSFRFVLFRPFSVLFRPPKSNYLFKLLPHMFRPLKKKAIPMICFESQECYPKAHLISKIFRFVLFRPFSVLFRPPKSNYLFKLLPHMSRPLKKKAIPMICFESQECYPKAHLTSKSFRFVLFRPFSVLFRPPKSNYLFKLLPHMSRPLKKKAIPMICFESQECYPQAHLTSKSFRFVLFRPFSVLFRPSKSNYLFKLLPHMFRPLNKEAIPMICFESQECHPKAHLISKIFRFVLFRPFSVLFRPPKSNYLFKLLPHMSRPLKKEAIPKICFESQECYPKAHLISKIFRFVLFRPFSVLFRPPKSNYLFKLLPHMSPDFKKLQICAFQTFFGPFQTT